MENNFFDFKIGDKISFTAGRITKGNPVSGELIFKDETGFAVKLDHVIEGLVQVWQEDEVRRFGFWNTYGYKLLNDEKKGTN